MKKTICSVEKREQLLRLKENISDRDAFLRGIPSKLAPLIQSIPRVPEDVLVDNRYVEWIDGFIDLLSNADYSATLNVIEKFQKSGTNMAYLIRRFFEFVYAELSLSSVQDCTKIFSAQRHNSSDFLNAINDKCIQFRTILDQEMVVDDETISLSASVPLKRTKQELAVLISSAMKTLQDIYFYEMAISSVKSLRMVCGLFLAIRLQMLLPIDSKHPNRRLWKELAILMTTSRLVIVSKGWFQTTEPNKQYKPDALRVMASDIQTGQFMRLPLAMKAVNPDFFCELEAGKGPEAMAGLQAGGKYHPTDEAIFTIGLANQFNLRGF